MVNLAQQRASFRFIHSYKETELHLCNYTYECRLERWIVDRLARCICVYEHIHSSCGQFCHWFYYFENVEILLNWHCKYNLSPSFEEFNFINCKHNFFYLNCTQHFSCGLFSNGFFLKSPCEPGIMQNVKIYEHLTKTNKDHF